MTVSWVPLKYLAMLNPETLDDSTNPDHSFHYVDIATTGRGYLREKPELMSFGEAPSRARRVLRPGDTILSTVRTYLRAAWTVRDAADHLVASTGFVCLRPHPGVDPRYLGWVAQTDTVVEEIVARSVGVSYPAINPSEVGRIEAPQPPLSQQRAIADHLDRETERIDALIRVKRKMAKLLEESWTTFRSKQILGGLNPLTGKGAVPSGWQVRSLGATITLQRGHDLPSEQRAEGDVPVVSSGGPSGWHDQAVCQPPGVVTGRYGTIGKTYFVDVPYWPLNTTLYVSDFRGNNPRWTFHMLATLPLAIDEEKSAVTGINRNVVAGLKVPVPPPSEQTQIASEIDDVRRRGEGIQRIVQAQVTLLQERRQALITAAVTGQLDIPEAA